QNTWPRSLDNAKEPERGLSQAAAGAPARASRINPWRSVPADALRSGTLRAPRKPECGLSEATAVTQATALWNGPEPTPVANLLRRWDTPASEPSSPLIAKNYSAHRSSGGAGRNRV